MAKRKRTLLLFPPAGARVRSVRFRLWMVILLGVLLVGGYAGYLIPFGSFTIDVVELNRKRNLADQNKDLLQRILASLKMLNTLRAESRRLDSQHTTADRLLGVSGDKTAKKPVPFKAGFTALGLDGISSIAQQDQNLAAGLCRRIATGVSLFDSIPVLIPVQGYPSITMTFGKCLDPFTQTVKMHGGVDFVAPPGTKVLAAASGTVSVVETSHQWGRRVVINHGYGFSTVYAHLGSVLTGQGRLVRRGDPVGTMGFSGLATGPHLHYEVRQNGIALNPADYFPPSADSVTAIAMEN